MRVLCVSTSGKDIPPEQRYLAEVEETDFSPLQLGEEYLVFGLLFILDRIDFLICPSNENPIWAPSSLFELIDTRVPDGWEICLTRSNQGYELLFETFKIHSIIGYSFLVNSYAHYCGVLERDRTELEKFFREKKRIEEWWSLAK